MALNNRVLVLGVDDRSTLSVIRSLGRKGIAVDLGTDDPLTICQYSRYTNKVIDFPNPGSQKEEWLSRLIDVIGKTKYDLIIPTVDNYLVLIVKNYGLLEKYSTFAVPDKKGFEYTYDKGKTFELAESLSVQCPKTLVVTGIKELDKIKEQFKFPLIFKPRSSKVWKDGRKHSLNVSIVRDSKELKTLLEKTLKICPVLIQSFHFGNGLGQEFLMKNGEPLAVFQHERVHEPIGGGGSSYRKSVEIDQTLLQQSLKLLKAINWNGVAMVEYKRDKSTGEAVLIEINGRFWGSLPLAIHAGVDFPSLLYDMTVNKITSENISFKKNIYCRNIVKDFNWLKENLRADKSDPLLIVKPFLSVIGEVKNILLLRERYDTLVMDDLKPGIKIISSYIADQFSGLWGKIKKLYIKVQFQKNAIRINKRRKRIKKLFNNDVRINFVCKGNICRSSFAEFSLKKILEDKNIHSIKVESSGFIERINRQSPETAQKSSLSFNVDLSAHRSKLLTKSMAENADILFVMDIELYLKVIKTFPEVKRKVFFLTEAASHKTDLEILDPYGNGQSYFDKTYSQIHALTQDLVQFKVVH